MNGKMNKEEMEKFSILKRETLDERFYFQSLLNQAFEHHILEGDEIAEIQMQSFALLKERVQRYNGFDSTSISTDKASSIMESNLYTIGVYLKKFIPDEAIQKIKTMPMTQMYREGRKEIEKKIEVSRVLYQKVLANKIVTQNSTYNDTVIGGIKGFFKIYDPDFEANHIKITADYPLYHNVIGELDGIELMQTYLSCLYYENEFCNLFSQDKIHALLYSYSPDFQDLLINIFQVIVTEAIGIVLAGENVYDLTISNKGLQQVYQKLVKQPKEEVDKIIQNAYEELKKTLLKNKSELQKYIQEDITKVQLEIYNAVTTNTLKQVFFTNKWIEK